MIFINFVLLDCICEQFSSHVMIENNHHIFSHLFLIFFDVLFFSVAGTSRLLITNPCLASRPLVSNHFLTSQKPATNHSLGTHTSVYGVRALHLQPPSLKAAAAEEEGCKSASDYARLWTIERAVTIGMTGIMPLAFIFPSNIMDYLLAFSLTLHAHWGLEAVVVDYLRPKVVGPFAAKAAVALVHVVSALTLGGLFYFNYSDVGLVQCIKMLWKL